MVSWMARFNVVVDIIVIYNPEYADLPFLWRAGGLNSWAMGREMDQGRI